MSRLPFTHTELHDGEEHIKTLFREQISEIAGLMEVFVSILVIIGLLVYSLSVMQYIPALVGKDGEAFTLFLEEALNLVIGVEFVKMLAKHSPGSALEVLLYAIARHMVVGRASAVENLLGVAAIAIIFIIRKFWFVPSFGATMPDGKPAPDRSRIYGEEDKENPQA